MSNDLSSSSPHAENTHSSASDCMTEVKLETNRNVRMRIPSIRKRATNFESFVSNNPLLEISRDFVVEEKAKVDLDGEKETVNCNCTSMFSGIIEKIGHTRLLSNRVFQASSLLLYFIFLVVVLALTICSYFIEDTNDSIFVMFVSIGNMISFFILTLSLLLIFNVENLKKCRCFSNDEENNDDSINGVNREQLTSQGIIDSIFSKKQRNEEIIDGFEALRSLKNVKNPNCDPRDEELFLSGKQMMMMNNDHDFMGTVRVSDDDDGDDDNEQEQEEIEVEDILDDLTKTIHNQFDSPVQCDSCSISLRNMDFTNSKSLFLQKDDINISSEEREEEQEEREIHEQPSSPKVRIMEEEITIEIKEPTQQQQQQQNDDDDENENDPELSPIVRKNSSRYPMLKSKSCGDVLYRTPNSSSPSSSSCVVLFHKEFNDYFSRNRNCEPSSLLEGGRRHFEKVMYYRRLADQKRRKLREVGRMNDDMKKKKRVLETSSLKSGYLDIIAIGEKGRTKKEEVKSQQHKRSKKKKKGDPSGRDRPERSKKTRRETRREEEKPKKDESLPPLELTIFRICHRFWSYLTFFYVLWLGGHLWCVLSMCGLMRIEIEKYPILFSANLIVSLFFCSSFFVHSFFVLSECCFVSMNFY